METKYDNPETDQRASLIKRIAVAVVGGFVTIVGIALIVLPGPAFIVIPLGLSILATQFEWPKRVIEKAKKLEGGRGQRLMDSIRRHVKRLTGRS